MALLALIRGNLMEYQKKKNENITKSGSNFAPTFVDHHILPEINFNGHSLIKNNISIPKKVTNIYTSYTLTPCLRNLNPDFTLNNCLFGSVMLTKNVDLDKYIYSGYDIGFDSRSEFSFTDGSMGRNVIIFGADMNSSVHIDNKGRDMLILGEGPTQGLDGTTLTAEAIYPINFTQTNISLYYNWSNSLLFANATEVYQFKAKDCEIKDYALCLGNIWKDFTIDNIKKTGLKRVVNFFSVDFDSIETNDILDIHKYLMKGTWYKKMFGLIKKIFIRLSTGTVSASNYKKCVSLSN